DPSPNTIRNEAFEEYYARVDYANKNYRSYNDGWLTDMGMIHIVLGAPSTSDRRVNTYDGRTSITWTYSGSNRRFVFIDNTGFGDYRLSPSTPFPMSEKYKYTGM
ncbi:MAG: GWxTD domain-containing protein, partial [Candidatus Kapabacteria bacterium]|nr:GWxTD domain-containing protein [Candidatus Kapabacteria bacterium]